MGIGIYEVQEEKRFKTAAAARPTVEKHQDNLQPNATNGHP
jgi:hypothetical protein